MLRGQLVVVGDDGAALEGVEELGGVEAEDLGVAEAADMPAPVRAAEGVGRVEQQLQAVPAAISAARRRRTAGPRGGRR